MESEREQMRGEMGEGEGPELLSAMQRGIFTRGVFQKDISLWEQLFGSRQAVVTGKYIRPDLVCFGCFGDAAIMRDRGLVIEQGQFDSFSYSAGRPVLVCSFSTCVPSYLFPLLSSLVRFLAIV